MSTKTNNATEFIHVASGDQPLYLSQIRKREKEYSLPISPTVTQMSEIGYEVIQPTERPSGDVVTQGDAVLENGVWKQSWIVRSFTPEEIETNLNDKRTQHLHEIEVYRTRLLEKGVSYEFNEGTYHIQVRDCDRANLAGLRLRANALIEQDISVQMPFRTAENEMVSLTPIELVSLTDVALEGYYLILENVWTLKDLTNMADSIEDFPVIPNV